MIYLVTISSLKIENNLLSAYKILKHLQIGNIRRLLMGPLIGIGLTFKRNKDKRRPHVNDRAQTGGQACGRSHERAGERILYLGGWPAVCMKVM